MSLRSVQHTLRPHALVDVMVTLVGAILMRPATFGYFLASMDDDRPRPEAFQSWENELRYGVQGLLSP